jgi:hypothetical protein
MMQVKYRSGRGAAGPYFPSSGGAVEISISPFQTLTHALAEMYGLVLSSGKVHASFNRRTKEETMGACRKVLFFYSGGTFILGTCSFDQQPFVSLSLQMISYLCDANYTKSLRRCSG